MSQPRQWPSPARRMPCTGPPPGPTPLLTRRTRTDPCPPIPPSCPASPWHQPLGRARARAAAHGVCATECRAQEWNPCANSSVSKRKSCSDYVRFFRCHAPPPHTCTSQNPLVTAHPLPVLPAGIPRAEVDSIPLGPRRHFASQGLRRTCARTLLARLSLRHRRARPVRHALRRGCSRATSRRAVAA